MKKYALIFLFATFLVACNEDKTVDVTVMPEETTAGANTFGCVVDGWLYVGGRFSDEYHNLVADRFPSINFRYNAGANNMDVVVKVEESGYIAFTINDLYTPVASSQLRCTYSNARFLQDRKSTEGKDLGSGTVELTRFDKAEGIVSGRFWGSKITHGQFDVKYK